MIFNNGVPVTAFQPQEYSQYQQYSSSPQYYQQQQRQWQQPIVSNQQQQQQSTSPVSMVWVQGEQAAKSYMLPNNTTLPLWDSESQTIYIKSVDAYGKPSLVILDYHERTETENTSGGGQEKIEFATKEQFETLNEQLSLIKNKFENTGRYVTEEQLKSINGKLNGLNDHITDIEDRITSFGKPQQNQNNKRSDK